MTAIVYIDHFESSLEFENNNMPAKGFAVHFIVIFFHLDVNKIRRERTHKHNRHRCEIIGKTIDPKTLKEATNDRNLSE